MAANSRPYKVWSSDRRNKKSVTASSLQELIVKAREKLSIPQSDNAVRVVFEADGTEVDEEEYFQFLPFNTTLLVMRSGEVWRDASDVEGKDEPDYMMADGSEISDRVKQLATGLKKEITRLITFSNEDLHEMAGMAPSNLALLLGDTETYAKAVQEACRRHLGEREETSEALQLLKLYHKAREHSPYVDDDSGPDGAKKQKFANT